MLNSTQLLLGVDAGYVVVEGRGGCGCSSVGAAARVYYSYADSEVSQHGAVRPLLERLLHACQHLQRALGMAGMPILQPAPADRVLATILSSASFVTLANACHSVRQHAASYWAAAEHAAAQVTRQVDVVVRQWL